MASHVQTASHGATGAKAFQKHGEQLNCSVCQENIAQARFLPCNQSVCQKCMEAENQIGQQSNGLGIRMVNVNYFTDVGENDSAALVDKCKVPGKGITKTHTGQKAGVSIAIPSTPGSAPGSLPNFLTSYQPLSPNVTCPTACNNTETVKGQYKVSYTPATSDPHQVRVRPWDSCIPGSHFPVQGKMMGTSTSTFGGLRSPWGVDFGSNGCVVVTNCWDQCVMVLDKEAKTCRRFGSKGTNTEQFQYPRGVAITRDDKIIVSDELNCRIQKFDMEGKFMDAVGSKGNQRLQFHYPHGIAVDKNNKILVADRLNHRIQVMNSDLTYSHSFGFRGSQSGEFRRPCCLAIDSKEMIYVTDRENHRVQKFTPEGVFVTQFGKEGRGSGEFTLPCGVAVDTNTDTVFVSSDHKVSVFTTEGNFLIEFGKFGREMLEFDRPTGLAVDESTGDFYVCDCRNDRLVVY